MLNWYDKCVVCLRRSQSMNLWHALDEDMNRILLDVSVSSSIKLGNKRLIAVNWRDTIFQDIVSARHLPERYTTKHFSLGYDTNNKYQVKV